MTREDRWIVSLDEIRAIRWECPKCHMAISYTLTETIRLAETCPSCGEKLLDTFVRPRDRAYGEFVATLKSIVPIQREPAAGRLWLEFLLEPPATRR